MIDFRLQDAALDFFSDNELPSCMYNVDGTSLLYIVSLATYLHTTPLYSPPLHILGRYLLCAEIKETCAIPGVLDFAYHFQLEVQCSSFASLAGGMIVTMSCVERNVISSFRCDLWRNCQSSLLASTW